MEHPDDQDIWDHFDADADRWWSSVVMWRPRLLSDEDMRIHFHDLDGRWSRQTAEQMIRTGLAASI